MIKLNKNSLVVVTGAAKGNGKAIAEACEKSGAMVVRVDLLELETNQRNFVGKVTDENLISKVVSYCSEQKYETLSLINALVNFEDDEGIKESWQIEDSVTVEVIIISDWVSE